MIDATDRGHLERCIALATEALAAGDAPFGSVLADADRRALAEDRNRGRSAGDPTRHPELGLARWAARNLASKARAAATVYTSGEHCPMCAAAHAQVGLGRIVYIVSAAGFAECIAALGHPDGPVRNLPIAEVAPGLPVQGPVPELVPRVLDLYRRHYGRD